MKPILLAAALTTAIPTAAATHCYSIWHYKTPQRCGVRAQSAAIEARRRPSKPRRRSSPRQNRPPRRPSRPRNYWVEMAESKTDGVVEEVVSGHARWPRMYSR